MWSTLKSQTRDVGFAPIGRDPLRLHLPVVSIALLFPVCAERLHAARAAATSPLDADEEKAAYRQSR